MPGVVVTLVTQVVLPKSLEIADIPVTTLTIPVAALAIGVDALFVCLTPAYTTSINWLEQLVVFHRSETDLGHEEAKEYTQVERILPQRDHADRRRACQCRSRRSADDGARDRPGVANEIRGVPGLRQYHRRFPDSDLLNDAGVPRRRVPLAVR